MLRSSVDWVSLRSVGVMTFLAMLWKLNKLVDFISFVQKLQIILTLIEWHEIWNIFLISLILSTINRLVVHSNISLFVSTHTSFKSLLISVSWLFLNYNIWVGNTTHSTAVVKTSQIWMDIIFLTWNQSDRLEVVILLNHVFPSNYGVVAHGSRSIVFVVASSTWSKSFASFTTKFCQFIDKVLLILILIHRLVLRSRNEVLLKSNAWNISLALIMAWNMNWIANTLSCLSSSAISLWCTQLFNLKIVWIWLKSRRIIIAWTLPILIAIDHAKLTLRSHLLNLGCRQMFLALDGIAHFVHSRSRLLNCLLGISIFDSVLLIFITFGAIATAVNVHVRESQTVLFSTSGCATSCSGSKSDVSI